MNINELSADYRVVSDSNDTRLRVTTLDCKHSMYTTVLWREARCSQRKSSKGDKPVLLAPADGRSSEQP